VECRTSYAVKPTKHVTITGAAIAAAMDRSFVLGEPGCDM
jgi:hypothetical protein